jgi:hypothetical protein
MESDQKPETPTVWVAKGGATLRWPLLAAIAVGLVAVAALVGWSLGKSSSTAASAGSGVPSQSDTTPPMAGRRNAERSSDPAVSAAAAVPTPLAPPAPPRAPLGPVGENAQTKQPPLTPRPQAALPWKRLLENPEEASVTPADLPWRREKGEFEPATLDLAELPWKRSLDAPDPVIVNMAALPWKLYFGR